MLAATRSLVREFDEAISGSGSGVVAIGPIGEGKSLGLKQAAVQVAAANPSLTVLWREPGAPPITESWLTDVLAAYDRIVVCADEADLVSADMLSTRRFWEYDPRVNCCSRAMIDSGGETVLLCLASWNRRSFMG